MAKIERLAYICIIVMCVLTVYVLIDAKIQRRPPTAAAQVPGEMVGKPLSVEGANWSDHKLNLVVAMTTKCRFCSASLPFYRRLADAVRTSRPAVSLTVVSSEPLSTMIGYLAEQKVLIPSVVKTPFRALGVQGTPTIFVVTSFGIVKRVYLGKLSPDQEGEVLKTVNDAHT